jgi:hypothetical protein
LGDYWFLFAVLLNFPKQKNTGLAFYCRIT